MQAWFRHAHAPCNLPFVRMEPQVNLPPPPCFFAAPRPLAPLLLRSPTPPALCCDLAAAAFSAQQRSSSIADTEVMIANWTRVLSRHAPACSDHDGGKGLVHSSVACAPAALAASAASSAERCSSVKKLPTDSARLPLAACILC